jgi:hypothetical protein
MEVPGCVEARLSGVLIASVQVRYASSMMYVCMYLCIFFVGGREARKVPYWGTGRAEQESLVLEST